ncbi:MAG TPA: MazG nucleotide pyrophosphohydrolase domain-containing protein [Patescibacteria group bacterium]|nr:MazG nucleotide pyrophosphohydrolase domain-containing protein [Patescibacteria group bacterium]
MTIEELQQWVDEDWKRSSKPPTLEAQLLFAIEEFGEVAEAIRKKTMKHDYKVDDNALGSEFADLVITITTLANTFDVDLTKELRGFQQKLESRRAA